MTDFDPRAHKKDADDASDLAKRLANYRSRVEREGRKAALERLDRAIDKVRQKPTPSE